MPTQHNRMVNLQTIIIMQISSILPKIIAFKVESNKILLYISFIYNLLTTYIKVSNDQQHYVNQVGAKIFTVMETIVACQTKICQAISRRGLLMVIVPPPAPQLQEDLLVQNMIWHCLLPTDAPLSLQVWKENSHRMMRLVRLRLTMLCCQAKKLLTGC